MIGTFQCVYVCVYMYMYVCVCMFSVPCHEEEERSVISLRQCFSSLRQAEDWRIKVHWFLQPPGHRLKCELWLGPLLGCWRCSYCNPHHPIHPLPLNTQFPSPVFFIATFPTIISVCFGQIAQYVYFPTAQRHSADSKHTEAEFLHGRP